jgi:hypothetical protein
MYSVAQTSDGYIWIVHWNIRELQNLRERAALLSNGPSLRVPLAEILTALGLGATGGANWVSEVLVARGPGWALSGRRLPTRYRSWGYLAYSSEASRISILLRLGWPVINVRSCEAMNSADDQSARRIPSGPTVVLGVRCRNRKYQHLRDRSYHHYSCRRRSKRCGRPRTIMAIGKGLVNVSPAETANHGGSIEYVTTNWRHRSRLHRQHH